MTQSTEVLWRSGKRFDVVGVCRIVSDAWDTFKFHLNVQSAWTETHLRHTTYKCGPFPKSRYHVFFFLLYRLLKINQKSDLGWQCEQGLTHFLTEYENFGIAIVDSIVEYPNVIYK